MCVVQAGGSRRATEPMSHFEPTARAYSEGSTLRYSVSQSLMRGILFHASPFRYSRIGWKGNSRAIVWTAWPAISLETMMPWRRSLELIHAPKS